MCPSCSRWQLVGKPRAIHSTGIKPRVPGGSIVSGPQRCPLIYPPGVTSYHQLSPPPPSHSLQSNRKSKEKSTKASAPANLNIQSFSLRDASLLLLSEAFRLDLSSSLTFLPASGLNCSLFNPVSNWNMPCGLEAGQGYLGPVLSFNPFRSNVGLVHPRTLIQSLLGVFPDYEWTNKDWRIWGTVISIIQG